MELHQLRYFVAVAETGGFSRAAARCNVAQPSLSQQIQRLERELGQRLFDRLGRTIELTEAGHALLPRATRILREVREARDELERDLEAGVGPLKVGAIPTIAPYLLPPVLCEFVSALPTCAVRVREDLTEGLLEAVVDHEIDCAIVAAPIDHELIEIEPVGRERLVAALPPGCEVKGTLSLSALERMPAIVLHEMHCLGRQIQSFCASRRQSIVCRSAQLSTVQSLVGLGLGVSLVPEMCAAATPDGRYLPLAGGGPTRELAIAWRRDRSRSTVARRFVDLVRETLASGRHRLREPNKKGESRIKKR